MAYDDRKLFPLLIIMHPGASEPGFCSERSPAPRRIRRSLSYAGLSSARGLMRAHIDFVELCLNRPQFGVIKFTFTHRHHLSKCHCRNKSVVVLNTRHYRLKGCFGLRDFEDVFDFCGFYRQFSRWACLLRDGSCSADTLVDALSQCRTRYQGHHNGSECEDLHFLVLKVEIAHRRYHSSVDIRLRFGADSVEPQAKGWITGSDLNSAVPSHPVFACTSAVTRKCIADETP